jgi:hypothetical protein
MSVIINFAHLNLLRPANARFGEVVCFELFFRDEFGAVESLGYTKRKSIHVPPSTNAYWNWKGVEAMITQLSSRKGFRRVTRSYLYQRANELVEKTYIDELDRTYNDQSAVRPVQYYSMYITKLNSDPKGFALMVMGTEQFQQLFGRKV